MYILRSIGAVAAGLAVIVLLCVLTDALLVAIHILPSPNGHHLYALVTLGVVIFYCTVYTLVGGYVTARLAPTRPVAHAVVLGLLGMALSNFGTLNNWQIGNGWNAVTLLAEGLPLCWLGGIIWTQMFRPSRNSLVSAPTGSRAS